MKTIHLKVYGRVQGVFFRQSALQQAKALHLSGWVRNKPDGSVEIMATGEEKNIQQFISWCNQGPPHAVVNKLEAADAALENFASFEIVR